MNGLGALIFADWRALRNDARRALRSPGRLALWAFYLVALGFFGWLRTVGSTRGPASAGSADPTSADLFLCTLLFVLAISLAFGRGTIGIFRSRAEARFIIGSPIPAPIAIAYLQTRETLAQCVRFLFSFIYFIFVFAPRHLPPAALFADLLLIVAIFAATAAVVVPRRLLRGAAAAACAVAGCAGALVAAAIAVRDAVTRVPVPLPPAFTAAISRFVPAWHPGRALLAPDPLLLVEVLVLAAAATALLASAGRDAYPELYALSVARIDRLENWRERRRGRSGARAAALPAVRPGVASVAVAPSGVLIFIWKSFVEFGRQTNPRYVALGALLAGTVGFAAARVLGNDDVLFGTVMGVCAQLLLVLGFSATGSLAAEVRRPLFWLSDSMLFERLAALAFAGMWRTILTMELVAAGFAAGGGKAFAVMLLAAGFPALTVLLASVGFTAFTLFPSAADWRGPVIALRYGLSVAAVVPPLALFGIVAAVFGALAAALGAAVLLALLQAAALIGVAAWRLDGRIDRLAA